MNSTLTKEQRIAAVRTIETLAVRAGGRTKDWKLAERQLCEKYGITARQLGAWKREEQRAIDEAEPEMRVRLADGSERVLRPETDARIIEVIDGKLFTHTEAGAESLAAELVMAGVNSARPLGFAVVFWG